jgi:hypothetical protein
MITEKGRDIRTVGGDEHIRCSSACAQHGRNLMGESP